MTPPRPSLDIIAEFLVEDILAMSDEGILAECIADGEDPTKIAAEMRAIFEGVMHDSRSMKEGL